MRKYYKEAGVAIPLFVVASAGLCLFMFATVKLLAAILLSLETDRHTLQVSAVMQSNTPFKDGAMETAAVALHVFGYEGARAQSGEQPLADGVKVQLHYDDGEVPHISKVKIDRDYSAILRWFGIENRVLGDTEIKTAMGMTTKHNYADVYIDNSYTMVGRWDASELGLMSIYEDLIEKVGLEVADNDTTEKLQYPGRICWPISVDPCYEVRFGTQYVRSHDKASFNINNPIHVSEVWGCCERMRAFLPFFINQRASAPITFPSWDMGYQLANPLNNADRNEKFTTNLYPPGHNTSSNLLWRAPNPSIDYSVLHNGHTMAQAHANYIGGNIDFTYPLLIPTYTNQWLAFPPPNMAKQFEWHMIPPNRLVTWDLTRKISINPNTNVNGITEIYPPICATETECQWSHGWDGNAFNSNLVNLTKWEQTLGANITNAHLAVRGWRGTHWISTEEQTEFCGTTVPPSGNPESPDGGPCGSQHNWLRRHFSSFWKQFQHLTQTFLVAASETVPTLGLSLYSGPSHKGAVAEEMEEYGIRTRWPGLVTLHDPLKSSGTHTDHLFDTKIDVQSVLYDTVYDAGGNSQIARKHLSLPLGDQRLWEMLAYVSPRSFPNLVAVGTPEGSSDPTAADYNYWKERDENGGDPRLAFQQKMYYQAYKNYMGPVEHPERPWEYFAPNNTNRFGRAITNEIFEQDYQSFRSWVALPGYWLWKYWAGGDTYRHNAGVGPRQYFPLEGGMIIDNIISSVMSPPVLNTWDGVYTSPILNNLDWNTGEQLAQPYEYETVSDYATPLYNLSTPTTGGTDFLAAIDRFANRTCPRHRAFTGNPESDCVMIAFGDGRPDFPSYDPGNEPEIPGPFTYSNQFDNWSDHFKLIKAAFDKYKDDKNVYYIMVFTQHQANLDPETEEFLGLYDGPRRLLIPIPLTSLDDYKKQFKAALSLIVLLLRYQSSFIDAF